MAKKSDQNKEENLKKYQERLKSYKEGELVQPDKVPTIDELAAQGAELLAKDDANTAKKFDDLFNKPQEQTPKPQPPKQTGNSSNPYVKARENLLAKYPEWKKGELLKMERENNKDNRFYQEFVDAVRFLGDQISR